MHDYESVSAISGLIPSDEYDTAIAIITLLDSIAKAIKESELEVGYFYDRVFEHTRLQLRSLGPSEVELALRSFLQRLAELLEQEPSGGITMLHREILNRA